MIELHNKAHVAEAMAEIFKPGGAGMVDRYFAEPYIQHDPANPSGLAALKDIIAGLGQFSGFTYTPARLLADSDFVVAYGLYEGVGAAPEMSFDIFRLAGGKIVEHWDVMQSQAAPNGFGQPQADGPAPATDPQTTEANRGLIQDFVTVVWIGGQTSRLADYASGETRDQHNPGDWLRTGPALTYKRIHRLLADGAFVFAHSEGEVDGKRAACADLFHVENGKIVEHWGVIQEIPADSRNGNGMF